MTESEYRRLKRQLLQRYNDDLAALERVWALVRGRKEEGPVPPERAQIQAAVLKVVPELQSTFRLEDVLEKIRELDPDAPGVEKKSVSTALRRLAMEADQIEVLEVGIGRRPTVYRRREVIN